jgi:hypothetical protein
VSLLAIKPFEQKRGQRGWGRPKPLSLAKIAGNEQLAALRSKVARAVRLEHGYRNRYHHRSGGGDRRARPATRASVLPGAPEQLVDLSEAAPELELIRQGRFVMRVEPPLRTARRAATSYYAQTPTSVVKRKPCA